VTRVYLEAGKQRVFACALDWPGWCRSAPTADLALRSLASYANRYAEVARGAGVAFPAGTFEVVEQLPGSASTDFGVPEQFATADLDPVPAPEASRQAALVAAAWRIFDRAASAAPVYLRETSQANERHRDQIVEHVIASEVSYVRKLGVKHPLLMIDDHAGLAALRKSVHDLLAVASDGAPPIPSGWPPRYAARRLAWHALDHAWELQDRTG
jgi:hypothetical protein